MSDGRKKAEFICCRNGKLYVTIVFLLSFGSFVILLIRKSVTSLCNIWCYCLQIHLSYDIHSPIRIPWEATLSSFALVWAMAVVMTSFRFFLHYFIAKSVCGCVVSSGVFCYMIHFHSTNMTSIPSASVLSILPT